MANTYTQLNIHAVFSVKGRENFIIKKWKDELCRYIAGTLKATNNYSLAVGGHKDHIHIFFELNPTASVSDVLKNVKSKSSKWINEKGFVVGKFEWQSGYGAFSYSRSQRNDVIGYIMKQEQHHGMRSFKDEYLDLLKQNDIKYEEAYMFEFYE